MEGMSFLIDGSILADVCQQRGADSGIAQCYVGCITGLFVFSGDLVSVSSIVFELELTSRMLVTGIAWACAVGFIGGLFPAIRAARMPMVSALREL